MQQAEALIESVHELVKLLQTGGVLAGFVAGVGIVVLIIRWVHQWRVNHGRARPSSEQAPVLSFQAASLERAISDLMQRSTDQHERIVESLNHLTEAARGLAEEVRRLAHQHTELRVELAEKRGIG